MPLGMALCFALYVLASRLRVTRDRVEYEWGAPRSRIEVTRYDPKEHLRFTAPLINGKPVDLRPPMAYQSPFLHGPASDDQIHVTVGPISRVLDFSPRAGPPSPANEGRDPGPP